MTNGTHPLPSAIEGDTEKYPGWGSPWRIMIPDIVSGPRYTDLPAYWSPRRDYALAGTIGREDMWAAAVAKTATKFAAHGYVVKDSEDSTRRVTASQELLKRANGGEGWVLFALKIIQDMLTTDNGMFIRIRRANERVERVRVATKAESDTTGGFAEVAISSAAPGAKITGLYHLDSLRCTRTGNLLYPVRYQPLYGASQLLRYDQVLMYADMPSPRAELLGVGRCAAGRAYQTIATVAAMKQYNFEKLTGSGAEGLVFVQGINDKTLGGIVGAAEAESASKGLIYYKGKIIGAIPGDVDIKTVEIALKSLASGFVPKEILDDAYLTYANSIGVPVQDIQPLSGQGLGTGTQTVILEEAGRGVGMAAFVKWFEQTFSDVVFPASTTLEFIDENDVRDQKAKAEVRKMRAEERKTRIDSGEISPAMARQLALDDGDLPPDLAGPDATPGGQMSDDDKPISEQHMDNPVARLLLEGAPTSPPKAQPGGAPTLKDFAQTLLQATPAARAEQERLGLVDPLDRLLDQELEAARTLARRATDV